MKESSFLEELDMLAAKHSIPERIRDILKGLYISYVEGAKKNEHQEKEAQEIFSQLVHFVRIQLETPAKFESLHRKVTTPIDYNAFGRNFMRLLLQENSSFIEGEKNLQTIERQIAEGHNVILLANHQIEPDPQVISLLLEKKHLLLADRMIFVAGHRVITDPLAVPFSLGCNLICIYSKKHLDHPPEQRQEKLLHNQQTMIKLNELLSKGGQCIYVAPSGGRDRPNSVGAILPASLDSSSIDLFYLLTKRSKVPSHFYPLSLSTYHLMPPPPIVEKELGENRIANAAPAALYFGDEIAMEIDPSLDKETARLKRGERVTKIITKNYLNLESRL